MNAKPVPHGDALPTENDRSFLLCCLNCFISCIAGRRGIWTTIDIGPTRILMMQVEYILVVDVSWCRARSTAASRPARPRRRSSDVTRRDSDDIVRRTSLRTRTHTRGPHTTYSQVYQGGMWVTTPRLRPYVFQSNTSDLLRENEVGVGK